MKDADYEECEKAEWKKKKESEEEGKSPEFQVVHERKGFGVAKGRVYAMVVNIETRLEDAQYLKELLRAAMQQQTLRRVFIEAGIHLSDSPKQMISHLSRQNEYPDSVRAIPLMGIREEVMEKIVEKHGKIKTAKIHLQNFLGVKRIEKTSQTASLWKWLVLANKDTYVTTV